MLTEANEIYVTSRQNGHPVLSRVDRLCGAIKLMLMGKESVAIDGYLENVLRVKVTGPLLTSETCISAPNCPN